QRKNPDQPASSATAARSASRAGSASSSNWGKKSPNLTSFNCASGGWQRGLPALPELGKRVGDDLTVDPEPGQPAVRDHVKPDVSSQRLVVDQVFMPGVRL